MSEKDIWKAMEELSSRLFKTYVAVERLANNEAGYCFSKNESIAKKLKKHKDNISRDISDLVKLGYLKSIELRYGSVIIERRLYSNQNFKTYIEDMENIENLTKTTYETIDDIKYYYNERNPKYPKLTDDENVNGTVDENVIGADDENVKDNYYNINSSKTKTTTKEKTNVSSSFLELFSNHKLSKKTISNILSILTEKSEITEKDLRNLLKQYEKKASTQGWLVDQLKNFEEYKSSKKTRAVKKDAVKTNCKVEQTGENIETESSKLAGNNEYKALVQKFINEGLNVRQATIKAGAFFAAQKK